MCLIWYCTAEIGKKGASVWPKNCSVAVVHGVTGDDECAQTFRLLVDRGDNVCVHVCVYVNGQLALVHH